MGGAQSRGGSATMDELMFGSGTNIGSIVVESMWFPSRFSNHANIENDASSNNVRQDLVSSDESIKRFFFWRKKPVQREDPTWNQYCYESEEPLQGADLADSEDDHHYLQPTSLDSNARSSSGSVNEPSSVGTDTPRKVVWRCTNCMELNKTTEIGCRRCGLAETKF